MSEKQQGSVEKMLVSAHSQPGAVAGAIAARIRQGQETVLVQAVGAAAVNQAVKAISIARGFVTQNGTDLVAAPYFSDTVMEGQSRTAIVFELRKG